MNRILFWALGGLGARRSRRLHVRRVAAPRRTICRRRRAGAMDFHAVGDVVAASLCKWREAIAPAPKRYAALWASGSSSGPAPLLTGKQLGEGASSNPVAANQSSWQLDTWSA